MENNNPIIVTVRNKNHYKEPVWRYDYVHKFLLPETFDCPKSKQNDITNLHSHIKIFFVI